MKRSEYRVPAICINDHDYPFTEWILDNQKDVETRASRTLDPFIGKRVVLIRTGCGMAKAVGEVTIAGCIRYNGYEDFRADESRHMVEQGSKYDCKPEGVKYGYVLADPVEYSHPILLAPYTYTGDRVARDLHDFVIEYRDFISNGSHELDHLLSQEAVV